jgi:chemotaxis protein MotB
MMVLTSTIRKLSLPVVLGLLVFVAVGCGEEDKLRLQNQTLSERLEKSEADNARLKTEYGLTENEFKLSQRRMVAQSGEVERLKKDNANLKDGVLELQKIINELEAGSLTGRPLPQALNTALQDFADANPQIAEFDPAIGMVKFKSDLTFSPGSDKVKSQAVGMLKKLVDILNSPEGKRFAVYVVGHTDDVPIGRSRALHPTNWYLSAHRAVGVQQVLQSAGLSGDRIAVVGFGEYHPIASNATKAGKKLGSKANRRVEIWIVAPGPFLADQSKTGDAGKTPKPTPAPKPKEVEVEVEEVEVVPAPLS